MRVEMSGEAEANHIDAGGQTRFGLRMKVCQELSVGMSRQPWMCPAVALHQLAHRGCGEGGGGSVQNAIKVRFLARQGRDDGQHGRLRGRKWGQRPRASHTAGTGGRPTACSEIVLRRGGAARLCPPCGMADERTSPMGAPPGERARMLNERVARCAVEGRGAKSAWVHCSPAAGSGAFERRRREGGSRAYGEEKEGASGWRGPASASRMLHECLITACQRRGSLRSSTGQRAGQSSGCANCAAGGDSP